MRNPNKKIEMSRRGFLARSACASMGVGGVVNTLAHMRLMEGALANTVTSIGDYKAAIVLFHFGATDSNNMLTHFGIFCLHFYHLCNEFSAHSFWKTL